MIKCHFEFASCDREILLDFSLLPEIDMTNYFYA